LKKPRAKPSKAVQYAELLKTPAPKCQLGQSAYYFAVTSYGELGLYDSDPTGQELVAYKPEMALKLRDWLTDTFDDRPRLEGEK